MNFENGGTMRKELYLNLEKFSLRYAYFLFFDTREYLADSLFIRHQVRVWFEREYGKDGSPLLAICCHVKKKDVPAFLAALEDLKDKMILCGYQEYEQDVRIMLDSLESVKGAKQNNETNSTQKAEQT